MARQIFEDVRNPKLQNIYSLCLHIGSWQKIIIAATILIMAPLLILASQHSASILTQMTDMDWNEEPPIFLLSGTLNYLQGTQLVWQIPPSPKAVLFIAHGCQGSATHFWDKSPNCAECLGLPEERIIVMNALSKGYAVVAISSTRDCWSIATDKEKVMVTLSHWILEKGLDKLPVAALGASSGGYFVSALAREYRFSSIVIMISEGLFRTMRINVHYPATLFVHMVKDKRRANLVKEAMEMLRSKGVVTKEVKCYQEPVTPHYFTKIPGVSAITSERIHQALKHSDILDKENYMMMDGRSMNWMVPLRGRRTMQEEHYKQWDMHMRELLNLAFGFHETTSFQSDEIFAWLDTHLTIGAD